MNGWDYKVSFQLVWQSVFKPCDSSGVTVLWRQMVTQFKPSRQNKMQSWWFISDRTFVAVSNGISTAITFSSMSSWRSHNKRSKFLGSCGSNAKARSYDLLASTDFIIVIVLFHRVEMHCFSVVSSFRFTFMCFASVTSSLHVAITAATSSGKLYSG